MRYLIHFLLAFVSFTSVIAQQEVKVNTKGDNSPVVIGDEVIVSYGVRTDAIEAILWIYKAEGYDKEKRKKATEQILTKFAQSPERKQKNTKLSAASLDKIGITNAPKIINALEWDLFAQKYYLSTIGQNSPAVIAKGDVNIWYGIPPKALRALANQLEKNKTDISNFEVKLADQVKKYEELKKELETYASKEAIYQKAEALLEEGKLHEAEQLIESDYQMSKKRQAYKGYVYGKTKELLLKYEDAAIGYKDAVSMNNENILYHTEYAYNEKTLARYDEAIKHYQIALDINAGRKGNSEKKAALLNNLGEIWMQKGEYDTAIVYFNEVIKVYESIHDRQHPDFAMVYNNLGETLRKMNQYDKALSHFENALTIDTGFFGKSHINVARDYNNVGTTWIDKQDYEKAIGFCEKALGIDMKIFGEFHPYVARDYNNLGSAWNKKGEYDKAVQYFEKCQAIFQQFFPPNHPDLDTVTINLSVSAHSNGIKLNKKEKYEEALPFFQKALKNAKRTKDSLYCLNSIGATYKYLKNYEQGLLNLDLGIQKAVQLNQEIDQQADLKNLTLRMQYHKVGCLKGLNREKESETLAKQLWQTAIETDDKRLIDDLKKDGFDFGKK